MRWRAAEKALGTVGLFVGCTGLGGLGPAVWAESLAGRNVTAGTAGLLTFGWGC